MLDKIEKKAKNDKRAKTKSLYATLQLLIFTMSLKEITQSFLDREFSGLFSDAVLFEKSKVFSSYQAQQISLQYRVRKPRYKELKLSGNDSYEKKHEIRLFTYTPGRLWVSAFLAGGLWEEPVEFSYARVGEDIANLVTDDSKRMFSEIKELKIGSKGKDLYDILIQIYNKHLQMKLPPEQN